MFITLRGAPGDPVAIEVKTLNVVQVSLELALTVDQFYSEEADIMSNIAFILGIPNSRIRVVDVVADSASGGAASGGTTVASARRRLAAEMREQGRRHLQLTPCNASSSSEPFAESFTGAEESLSVTNVTCNTTENAAAAVQVDFEIGPDACSDGVITSNVTETDIDCGGPCVTDTPGAWPNAATDELKAACEALSCSMPKCADDSVCLADSDCVSGVCYRKPVAVAQTVGPATSENTDADDAAAGLDSLEVEEAEVQSENDDVEAVVTPAPLTPGVCKQPTCDDGVRNGLESDVDCGSSCSNKKCTTGRRCATAADCASGVCDSNGRCAAPTCSDLVQNGAETSEDCGGATCPACSAGRTCAVASDCRSGVCSNGLCAIPSCFDGVKNAGESDIDCGQSACGIPCPMTGAGCTTNADCLTKLCDRSSGKCLNATCFDGVQNGQELGPDCGGPDCAALCSDVCAKPNGQKPLNCRCRPGHNDCAGSLVCGSNRKCSASSCGDQVANGDESDVDCGGGCSSKCAVGKKCFADTDCQSGSCNAKSKTCVAPTCKDERHNGDEKDVDCGGSCGACGDGARCSANTDCRSKQCIGGRCEAASCTDSVTNGPETDIDCGGNCRPCDANRRCAVSADCATGLSCQGKSRKICLPDVSGGSAGGSAGSGSDGAGLADKLLDTTVISQLSQLANGSSVTISVNLPATKPSVTFTGTTDVAAILTSPSSGAKGFSIWYEARLIDASAVDTGWGPQCPNTETGLSGVGTRYNEASPPSWQQGTALRAVACAENLQQSPTLDAKVVVSAAAPVIDVVLKDAYAHVTVTSSSSPAIGFGLYYALNAEDMPTCPDTSSSSTGKRVPDDGLALSDGDVIHAIACGTHLQPSAVTSRSTLSPAPLPVFGEVKGTYPSVTRTVPISAPGSEGARGFQILYTTTAAQQPSCETGTLPAVGIPLSGASNVTLRVDKSLLRAVSCGTRMLPSAMVEKRVRVRRDCLLSEWSSWSNG